MSAPLTAAEPAIHPTCWIPGCDRPAQGRGTQPRPCWAHQPDDTEWYPVLITYTEEHVVWVEADSLEAAVVQAEYDTHEYLEKRTTLARCDLSVASPDASDFRWVVYAEGESYAGLPCDAHVKVYRERQRQAAEAACAAAGHPNPREYKGRPGTFYCPVCHVGVDVPLAVTP